MSTEQTPLLHSDGDRRSSDEQDKPVKIDRIALGCLLLQHISSMFGASLYSFASYIFLIEIFQDTLAPASIVGIVNRVAGLIFSGSIGGLIDRTSRIRFVRGTIAISKTIEIINYGLFLVLLGPLHFTASDAFRFKATTTENILTWSVISLTILFSSLNNLAGTGMEVAVERDWYLISLRFGAVITAQRLYEDDKHVDAYLPFNGGSLITYFLGYTKGGMVLIGMTAISMVIEFWWIQIVYHRFPILETNRHCRDKKRQDKKRQDKKRAQDTVSHDEEPLLSAGVTAGRTHPLRSRKSRLDRWKEVLRTERASWIEFVKLPIFWASLATTVRLLDTLKMDGIGVSYFKLARNWQDGYISLLKAGCLVTSTIGVASEPYIEKRLGAHKTGVFGLTYAILTLTPAVVVFFLPWGNDNDAKWSTIIMIGGIIITRSGSTCFSLVQLKQLQLDLKGNVDRNRLIALQSAVGNIFQLMRFVLTWIFSSSDTFKYTAGITLGGHILALVFYLIHIDGRRV